MIFVINAKLVCSLVSLFCSVSGYVQCRQLRGRFILSRNSRKGSRNIKHSFRQAPKIMTAKHIIRANTFHWNCEIRQTIRVRDRQKKERERERACEKEKSKTKYWNKLKRDWFQITAISLCTPWSHLLSALLRTKVQNAVFLLLIFFAVVRINVEDPIFARSGWGILDIDEFHSPHELWK